MDHHGVPLRVPVCTNMPYITISRKIRKVEVGRWSEGTWRPCGIQQLCNFFLRITCLCNLRLSILSQERKGPGSRLVIFIRTDASVNNLGNILSRIFSLSHTEADFSSPFFFHFYIFCSTLSLYPLSFLLCTRNRMWVPQTNNRCLRISAELSGYTIWTGLKYMNPGYTTILQYIECLIILCTAAS